MSLDVAALLTAATAGRDDRVRELTRGVPEAERRAALAEVKRAASDLRKRDELWSVRGRDDAVGLAVLAFTTGAAAVASHLTRWWRWGAPSDMGIVAMLVDRDVDWLPDVLRRLADVPARGSISGHWDLTEQLRVALGAARPTTPAYLQGLTWRLTMTRREAGVPPPPPLLDRLRADDELVALVPHILELEDAGNQLGQDKDYVYDHARRTHEIRPKPPEDTWAGAVAALCAEGRLDRAASADTCLRMLLRGGAPARTAHHLAMLTALALRPDEVAARQRTYVQVLGDGNGPSAKHAQRALRAVDDAGLLDLDTLLDASRLVLARPDKGLATTQLGWLDKVARRRDVPPDDLLLVVADAFGHERTDVQERALAVVAKHLARVRAETRDELVLAADVLAPSLRGTAADLLGAPVGDDPAAPRLEAAPAPGGGAGAWPAGARDVGELAEACAALVERVDDPVLLEVVLSGLARLRNADRSAFDTAMAPVRHRLRPRDLSSGSISAAVSEFEASRPPAMLLRMLLLEPAAPTGLLRGVLGRTRHVHRYALPDPPWSPGGVAVQRMREVAVRVMQGEVAELVSTPTLRNGLLDPDTLIERLTRLEAAGRQPWPADLQQALLRLPRSADGEVLARATRLASPAGRALADYLRRGHVDPPGRMLLGKIVPRVRRMWPSHPTGEVGLVALDGPPPDPASLGTLALSLPDPFLLAGHVHRFAARLDMGLWPTALPAHPEALAAHALIALCDLPESTGSLQTRSLVTALPGLDGPIGPAVALAVAYSLGAQDPPDRTAGADAVVGLAGRGEAGGPVGAVVAELVTRTGLKVGRVAGALAEASRAGPGVAEFVWQLAATALPTLLERGVRDTHRLVAVAADAAALIGARDRVDGLAEVAALGGSSRLVTEARRLDRVLTG